MTPLDGSVDYFSSVSVTLSQKRHYIERTAYTFFQLLADLGGFSGAIIFFPSVIMRSLSAFLFGQSLAN